MKERMKIIQASKQTEKKEMKKKEKNAKKNNTSGIAKINWKAIDGSIK